MKCLAAHLNGIPEWEVKGAFSLHLWQDSEHCTWLRSRVAEMRTPPLHLDRVPDPALETFFQELIRSRTTLELLTGIYRLLKPAVIAAMKRHIAEANPLADQPTLRLLKLILLEEEEQVAWGVRALQGLSQQASVDQTPLLTPWETHLRLYLLAAGGVEGDLDRPVPAALPPSRATEPFNPVRSPRRDERFTNLSNSRGPRPIKDDTPVAEWNLWSLYVRLTEMHVPELIALVLYDWQDQPWEFYHDLARHLWDEARHSMMGEIAFETRGIDWMNVLHDLGFAEYPNNQLEARDRYTLLWGSEQSLMKPSGKRRQFEVAQEAGDALSTTFHDFDWADEVLHTQIARKWLKPAFGSREEMQQVFEATLQGYEDFREADIQARATWWGDFYRSVTARQTEEGLQKKSYREGEKA